MITPDDTSNKIAQTYSLANKLLKEFGLDDWTFEFSNRKQQVGTCFHERKLIAYSIHFVNKTPWEEIEDTIRHEIAHALVGWDHGHDRVWRAKCLEVGARPKRCAGEEAQTTAQHNYLLRCPSCKAEWRRYRLKRQMIGVTCGRCNVELKILKRMKD